METTETTDGTTPAAGGAGAMRRLAGEPREYRAGSEGGVHGPGMVAVAQQLSREGDVVRALLLVAALSPGMAVEDALAVLGLHPRAEAVPRAADSRAVIFTIQKRKGDPHD